MLLCVTMLIGIVPMSISADGESSAVDNNGLLALYTAEDISVNSGSYNESLVMALPLSEMMPYRHLTPGTVVTNEDKTRYQLIISNDDHKMENARYVKVR